MNAKPRVCTIRTALVLAAALCFAVTSAARGYGAAMASNFWNAGTNPVGIRQDTTASGSLAEAYAGIETGGFKSSSQSTTGWRAGAKAYTLVHLQKFSMRGSFTFEHFQGEGMAGSMFITPATYPVDVIEFTPGSKTRQTYTFDGGVSVDITPNLRIGGGMNFLSANYSKRKDLRHTNYRLEMDVTPGVVWHDGDLSLGLNYILHRETETVTAEQVGTGESSYYAFLDKGLLYGAYEVWTGGGVHLDEAGVSGFPVAMTSHGAAVQLGLRDFFAEARVSRSQGTVGEKQQVWFRFPGISAGLTVCGKIRSGEALHTLKAELSWRDHTNYETVLEKVTSGGVSTVTEHGSNLIYDRQDWRLTPSWAFSKGALKLSASLALTYNSETSTAMYPYVNTQDTYTFLANAGGSLRLGRFTPGLTVSWGDGFWTSSSDVSDPDSGAEGEPYRLQNYWAGQMDYITASQIRLSPSLRFDLGRGMYLAADAMILKAFNLEIIKGEWRTRAFLRFGYNF